eukprot:TRINITY_DN77584_c0_g1_i1.p1 TRINITY_DN77584_c0_g1~~TRINITY_DN77584_c0_g1_i1.p1  ORF type:complete len:167 (-),score=43.21 TRINITY_DN77584_c0_g1_i1:219-719(-)
MLSLGYPMRKSGSGQVGGPRGSFKVNCVGKAARAKRLKPASSCCSLPAVPEADCCSLPVPTACLGVPAARRHKDMFMPLEGDAAINSDILTKDGITVHNNAQARNRRLRSAGSIASGISSRSSSCWSQAMRSTVLDLEVQLERERREAAEAELALLRARLASVHAK